MNWIVIEKFAQNVDEHIKLFRALSCKKTKFFVRKEILEFEELDDDEKDDILEENYELFKEGILWFDNEDIKRRIEKKVFEIVKKMQILKNEKSIYDIVDFWKKLEKSENAKYLEEIKALITSEIIKDKAKVSMLCHDNYAFKTKKNESYKYYISEGKLENETEYFKWYKMNTVKDVEKFIEQNLFNYNIILSQGDGSDIQGEYYINYYEGVNNILAIKDNKGDFCDVFKSVFMEKYVIKN